MAWDDDLVKGMGLSEVLGFGKHKGKTVERVCEESPLYLEWATDNNVIRLDTHAAAQLSKCLANYAARKRKRSFDNIDIDELPDHDAYDYF